MSVQHAAPDMPRYDAADYAALGIGERINGMWELSSVKGVPRRDLPPYGYLNDLWILTGDRLCIARTGSYPAAEPECGPASFAGHALRADGPREYIGVYEVSFDRWGRLVLAGSGGTRTFKLVSRKTSPIPSFPARIVLLEP
jgi:hypothetical protein